MKYVKIFILVSVIATAFSSCRKDDLGPSIFDTSETIRSEFDHWILTHYTDSFNINLIYRYSDRETSNTYNLVPPTEDKAKALAIMIRHIWLHAYQEQIGQEFIKTYSPRVIQLIGSPLFDGTGKVVVGRAEGGLKISLLNVNAIDIDNVYIDLDNPIPDTGHRPIDLNYWFFHTMHHEFCHILTQTKDYPTDFNTVSAGNYIPTDWHNKSDAEMIPNGFVSAYASSEKNEDFAECYATYITHTPEAWEALLTRAKDGAATITKKMDIVKQYFNDSWNVNLDDLRNVILKRSREVKDLDLRKLD